MVLVEKLHLPHAQPSELVEMLEKDEHRLWCYCSSCLENGLLV